MMYINVHTHTYLLILIHHTFGERTLESVIFLGYPRARFVAVEWVLDPEGEAVQKMADCDQ